MSLTINDITPIGLCLATQELFDAKRYCQNFCDTTLMKSDDRGLKDSIAPLKKELNSGNQRKYLEGHKAAIVSNIDKILALAATRYSQINFKTIESIVAEGRSLMKKVMFASSFDELNSLEPVFRSKISLAVYSLFLESMKRANVI